MAPIVFTLFHNCLRLRTPLTNNERQSGWHVLSESKLRRAPAAMSTLDDKMTSELITLLVEKNRTLKQELVTPLVRTHTEPQDGSNADRPS